MLEGDKHPLIKKYTAQIGMGVKTDRIKGSLILVDIALATEMHGFQKITTDSRFNSNVPSDQKTTLDTTGFLHYPRIDIADHIRARLRHYRAAFVENEFCRQHAQELPDIDSVKNIAERILTEYPGAITVVSNFLKRSALRVRVAQICKAVILKKEMQHLFKSCGDSPDIGKVVTTFEHAVDLIDAYLSGNVDWDNLLIPVTEGKGTTQTNQPRIPIDLKKCFQNQQSKELVFQSLGIKPDNVKT